MINIFPLAYVFSKCASYMYNIEIVILKCSLVLYTILAYMVLTWLWLVGTPHPDRWQWCQRHASVIRWREVLLYCVFHPGSVGCHGVTLPLPRWVWCLHGKLVNVSYSSQCLKSALLFIWNLCYGELILALSASQSMWDESVLTSEKECFQNILSCLKVQGRFDVMLVLILASQIFF